MILSDTAIKKPVLTVVTMLGLVVFGLYALLKLDVDEFPDISSPIVFVAIPYPGASPGQVERDVVDRLEEQFSSISGIDEVNSKSIDGFATITATFVFSKDPDQAAQDVRDAISAVRDRLPVDMKEPIIRKFDPNDLPIVTLVLSSTTLDPAALTQLADPGITKELRGVNGVAQVNIVGNVDREIVISVRPGALATANLSIAEVVQAVQTQNLSAPVGRVIAARQEQSIRLRGRLENPQEFANVIVADRGGKVIRIGDVADVIDGTAEARSAASLNGERAIGIEVTKTKGVSTTRVADGVVAKLAAIRKTLPPGTKLQVIKDSGVHVRQSVRNVEEALFEGAILTVLVVFLFLNSWRSTVITGLALPVSVLAAFIPVLLFGFTLNTMSLLGLSLAIGILIDDAIVVRENIVRHVQMGEDHVTAAHNATDEIGLAVTATTFSIMAVFVPVAFMGGIAGQWFKPFALTIACAVHVSLFVSFSLDPMLSAYWPDPQTEGHERRNVVARVLERFDRWFERQADRYKTLIAWALDHRALMILITVGAFVGAIALQATLGGSGFVPDSDRSELTLSLETVPGSSLAYTRAKAEEIATVARKHREVTYTYISIGSSDGSGGVDAGSIYIKLTPKKERKVSQMRLAELLRSEMSAISGVTAYTSNGGPGGANKQIAIQVRGDDIDGLTRFSEQLAGKLRKIPGATDVGLSTRGQKPELEVTVDRSLAASLGLSVAQIAQSLRPSFAGVDSGDWVDPTGKTRDVEVRLAAEERESHGDVEDMPLVVRGSGSAGGDPGAAAAAFAAGGAPASTSQASSSIQTIPLRQVATVKHTFGPAEIDHYNRDRVVIVGANVQGKALSDVTKAVNKLIAQTPPPPGIVIAQGGDVKSQGEVFGGIFAALGLAVMLMYFILVVQFGSFLDPLAILISLPLSLIGVVLTLLITGDTLNIMSLIGVMLLMGIVAKNAILLIDFAKWNHEKGMPLREALIEAGRVRLRPIIMTTLALIAGMIPVALGTGEGADFRAPLGRAVIGGTITSTMLTLLVIPTIYEILSEVREWLGRKFHRHAPEPQPSTATG